MELGAGQQQAQAAAPAPRLRPLDLGQKLDAGVRLSIRNFWTLAGLVLVLLVPITLIQFLITASTLPEDYTAGGEFGSSVSTSDSEEAEDAFVVGQMIVYVLNVFAFFIVPAVCFRAIAQAYLGEKANGRESLRYGLRRTHSVAWIMVLVVVSLFALFFLCAIVIAIGAIAPIMLIVTIPLGLAPLFYVGVSWVLALPAFMVEGTRGSRALGRSHGLIRGRWWRTFGLLVLAWILIIFFVFISSFLLLLLTYAIAGDDTLAAVGLNYIANLVAAVVTTPFFAALLIVLYFDLRVRKEAFDLQILAESIGGRAPSEAAAGRAMPWVAPPGTAPPPPAGWVQPQPQGWGQPQPQGWGQPQPQGWGQPPPQVPPAWGAPPPAPPPAWGAPPPAPPASGAPQQGAPPAWAPPQGAQPDPQPQGGQEWALWPPGPKPPPAEGQGWEPPVPPEPPDRSSS